MRANLDALGGLYESQRVLLALTQNGMSREQAYAAVQKNAMAAWQGSVPFKALLLADPGITGTLDRSAIEALFGLDYHFTHVDTIFARVFGA
jgi:adenylosuccinate lyase